MGKQALGVIAPKLVSSQLCHFSELYKNWVDFSFSVWLFQKSPQKYKSVYWSEAFLWYRMNIEARSWHFFSIKKTGSLYHYISLFWLQRWQAYIFKIILVFNIIVSWDKSNILGIQCSSLREELYLVIDSTWRITLGCCSEEDSFRDGAAVVLECGLYIQDG